MKHPVPNEALDDRIGIAGTAGSGKTYSALGMIARLIETGARTIIVDPLGVAWGLRLKADGKTQSKYRPVIFGGPYGDLPITPHAGTIIGETAASMKESAILDLSEIGTKAGERRFMLAFLTALYRKASGDPMHLILDEADMWAPQQIRDKDGEAAKLLGMVETIVRRGRVKGFIPWLITQRLAVINKDVLSQIDGMITMKVTAKQDRDALAHWVEGSADAADLKILKGEVPALAVGTGVVWFPARRIFKTAKFPPNATYDSSRTPKRGEKTHHAPLKALDIDGLRRQLEAVEEQAKENDPKALKQSLANARKEIAHLKKQKDPQTKIDAAYKRGLREGAASVDAETGIKADPKWIRALTAVLDDMSGSKVVTASTRAPKAPPVNGAASHHHLSGPQRKILESLSYWSGLGFDAPSRAQVAAAAGYSAKGSAFKNPLSAMNTAELVEYPKPGLVSLTHAGKAMAPTPNPQPARERLDSLLSGPQRKIIDALEKGEPLSRDELARRSGYSADGSAFKNPLSALKTLEIVLYPTRGEVIASDWIYQ